MTARRIRFIDACAAFVLVGLIVATEYVCRRHLMFWLPTIGITAVCFSLKHVLVDASFGRFLTITALGVIFGIVAQRKSWKASAALHIVINMLSSITALALGSI